MESISLERLVNDPWFELGIQSDINNYTSFLDWQGRTKSICYCGTDLTLPKYGHINIIICNKEQQDIFVSELKKKTFELSRQIVEDDATIFSKSQIHHCDASKINPDCKIGRYIRDVVSVDYMTIEENSLTSEFTNNLPKPNGDFGIMFISDFADFVEKRDYNEQVRRLGQIVSNCTNGWSIIFFTDKPESEWYDKSNCGYFERENVLRIHTLGNNS